jgi:hypothetical protein
MSAGLKRPLKEGSSFYVEDTAGRVSQITIVTLPPEPNSEETSHGKMKEYVDAEIQFDTAPHIGRKDLYDIVHIMNRGTIRFAHKNRGNHTLPAALYAKSRAGSVSSSSTRSSRSSTKSSKSSSGGARKTKRAKKGKTAKRSKKSRYTRRR